MEKAQKKSANGTKQATITIQLPVTLKNAFKSKTSAEGKQIRNVLCELIEKYVKTK